MAQKSKIDNYRAFAFKALPNAKTHLPNNADGLGDSEPQTLSHPVSAAAAA
jgi:hypothetical protein